MFLQAADLPYIPTYQENPVVEAYFQHVYAERQRRLGKDARLLGRVGTVFPNMSFLSRQPRSIAVWHPRVPSELKPGAGSWWTRTHRRKSRTPAPLLHALLWTGGTYRAGRHGKLELRLRCQ